MRGPRNCLPLARFLTPSLAPRLPVHLQAALIIFTILLLNAPLVAAQANRTVDDFSPLLTYSPASAVTHLDTTGFAVGQLYNGTVAFMNGGQVSINMTMNFTGSAIWLFLAKPHSPGGFSTGFDIFLDGVAVDAIGSFDENVVAEYGVLAYSNEELKLGPHIVQLAADVGAPVYFDYGVFTSNNATPEVPIPPVQPPSSSSSASGPNESSGTSTGTAPPGSQSQQTLKATSHIVPIAAGVAGGVLLFLFVAGACFVVRRRRRGGPGPIGGERKYNTYYGPGAASGSGLDERGSQAALTAAHSSQRMLAPDIPTPVPRSSPSGNIRDPFEAQVPAQQVYSTPTADSRHPQVHQNAPNQAYYPSAPAPHQSQYQHQPQDEYSPDTHPGNANARPYMISTRTDTPPLNRRPAEMVVDTHPYSTNGDRHPYDAPPTNTHAADMALEMDPGAQIRRVLAEQRAVEAEYARPRASAWPDEKAAVRGHASPSVSRNVSRNGSMRSTTGASASGRAQQTHAYPPAPHSPYPPSPNLNSPYPPSPNLNSAYSPGANSLGHARSVGHAGGVRMPTSPGDPAISNIAEQMRVLRAQVARLEVERVQLQAPTPYLNYCTSTRQEMEMGMDEEEEMPPAYGG
ncbi:hypothetical protein C8R44DRAFT_947653 [Mycena epipterygia]|nr:hypothetical protein C8R44DRAFT_947653 [Mycena epipterygia]